MKKPFDSILPKARKLAAMADPANNASPQEQETARAALQALRDEYNFSEEDLDPQKRERRGFVVKSRYRDYKARRDPKLALFARVMFAYIVGDFSRKVRIEKDEEEIPTRGLQIKMRAVFFASAECTPREFTEWYECFQHYAPAFIEMMDERRERLKQAKFEYERGWAQFCEENDIVPPLPPLPKGKEPSMEDKLRSLSSSSVPVVPKWTNPKLAAQNLLT